MLYLIKVINSQVVKKVYPKNKTKKFQIKKKSQHLKNLKNLFFYII
jgi:hypothetical protein